MEKIDILKSIGFSDKYIDKLNEYSEEVIEIHSTSVTDEIYIIETQDITSLKVKESKNSFNTNFQFKTK